MTAPDSESAVLDVILAGGGLANGLIALRLEQLRPELRVLLVEQGPTLGGNHTWSFHEHDLGAEEHARLAPFITRSWPRHRVLFPRYERTLPGAYHSIRSSQFHQVLSERLKQEVMLGARIAHLGQEEVLLEDGRRLQARCVIDGRGYPEKARVPLGYQKFLGLDLRLSEPHGLQEPVLMDARVAQTDGYRFFYLLPWSERELLVEDTYYSDTPGLPRDAAFAGIQRYARDRGWVVEEVLHEEQGVLPIPLGGDAGEFQGAVPCSGLRAGLFHPTTSYSLPQAVALADALARQPDLRSAAVGKLVRARSEKHWREGRFFRVLNRMLFLAARPEARIRIFEKFYRAPAGLIERFYAGRLTLMDRARILSGRPPVPVLKALQSVLTRSSVV